MKTINISDQTHSLITSLIENEIKAVEREYQIVAKQLYDDKKSLTVWFNQLNLEIKNLNGARNELSRLN